MGAEKDVRLIPLADLRIDGGTQARAGLCEETAAEYAEAMKAGDEFPAGLAFDDGESLWLAAGFHRRRGRELAGFEDMAVRVLKGTRRDAWLYAIGDNADHGLKRSREDKEKAVLMLLADDEWGGKSNREIAKAAAVVNSTVLKIRKQWEAERAVAGHDVPTYRIGGDGKPHPAKRQTVDEGASESTLEIKTEADTVEAAPDTLPIPATPPEVVLDNLHLPVPAELAEVFQDAHSLGPVMHSISAAKKAVEAMCKRKAGVMLQSFLAGIVADLDNARRAIACGRPFAVCPDCKGNGCSVAKGKGACKGTGWIVEDVFKRLPAEKKEWCRTRTNPPAAAV